MKMIKSKLKGILDQKKKEINLRIKKFIKFKKIKHKNNYQKKKKNIYDSIFKIE